MAGQELKYVTVQQVADIHEKLLARDGGLPGYRLGASLASVLDRVKNNIQYGGQQYRDASTVAALTTYAIVVGHPFNDANKRTALAAGVAVLRINDVSALPHPDTLKTLIVSAAAREIGQDEFVPSYLGTMKNSLSA